MTVVTVLPRVTSAVWTWVPNEFTGGVVKPLGSSLTIVDVEVVSSTVSISSTSVAAVIVVV